MKDVAKKVMNEYSKMKRKNPDAYLKNRYKTFHKALQNTGYNDFSKVGANPGSALGGMRKASQSIVDGPKVKAELNKSARLLHPNSHMPQSRGMSDSRNSVV